MPFLQNPLTHPHPRRVKARVRVGRGAREKSQNRSLSLSLSCFVPLSCLLFQEVLLKAQHSVPQGMSFSFFLTSSLLFALDARFHPQIPTTLYTIINTSPPRTRKTKSTPRPAFVIKWTIPIEPKSEWETRVRKVGEKGVTCFDVRCVVLFLSSSFSGMRWSD